MNVMRLLKKKKKKKKLQSHNVDRGAEGTNQLINET